MSSREDFLLSLALEEDLGHGDVTTDAIVDPLQRSRAAVEGRESFVLSGSRPFARVFTLLDPSARVEALFEDGDEVKEGLEVFRLEGPTRALLEGERTALNLLQRLCGVATFTRRMARRLEGTSCRLLDTRKTAPLWRLQEKEAVRHGGGFNHRFCLCDGVLIKDNHVAAAGGVKAAVERARARSPHTLRIEVEVDRMDQFREALEAKADIVLLDNFSLEMLREAVARRPPGVLLEASGGVGPETVRAIAETGVDMVSCGALTHSARAVDLHMEISAAGVSFRGGSVL